MARGRQLIRTIRLSPLASSSGGGTGDVVGPGSAVDGAIALFDTTTGKLIKDGGTNIKVIEIPVYVDNAGSALTTGIKYRLRIEFACTLTGWAIGLDQSGSIQWDIWKDTHANYPPTIADTITASAKPLVSSATKGASTTLTGWTTAIAAGDWLFFNIDSITTATACALILTATKS